MVSREEWTLHVSEFKLNGHDNVRAFCLNRQISYQTFRYWLQKTKPKNDEAAAGLNAEKSKGKLLPVVVQARASAKLHLCVNEVEVYLESSFDASFLKSVITALKEC